MSNSYYEIHGCEPGWKGPKSKKPSIQLKRLHKKHGQGKSLRTFAREINGEPALSWFVNKNLNKK